MEVALELGGRMGPIAGAKFSFAGSVESYVVKAPGPEYDGNVMGSHIVLDSRRQGRLYLQGDFIENAWIGHAVPEGRRSSRNPKTRIYKTRLCSSCWSFTLDW